MGDHASEVDMRDVVRWVATMSSAQHGDFQRRDDMHQCDSEFKHSTRGHAHFLTWTTIANNMMGIGRSATDAGGLPDGGNLCKHDEVVERCAH